MKPQSAIKHLEILREEYLSKMRLMHTLISNETNPNGWASAARALLLYYEAWGITEGNINYLKPVPRKKTARDKKRKQQIKKRTR